MNQTQGHNTAGEQLFDGAVAVIDKVGVPTQIIERFPDASWGGHRLLAVAQYLGGRARNFEMPMSRLRPMLTTANGERLTTNSAWAIVNAATVSVPGWLVRTGRGPAKVEGGECPHLYGWFGDPWIDGALADHDGVARDAVDRAFMSLDHDDPLDALIAVGEGGERWLMAGLIAAQRASGAAVPMTQKRAATLSGLPLSHASKLLTQWRGNGIIERAKIHHDEHAARRSAMCGLLVNMEHPSVAGYVASLSERAERQDIDESSEVGADDLVSETQGVAA